MRFLRLLLVVPLLTLTGCDDPGMVVGVTHTERTADYGPGVAGAELLHTIPLQNQHIMGWGALNPEPRDGRYQWDTLDRRIWFIQATNAEPVITLCCAPDWMKGGSAGATDWSRLEDAPYPTHYDDFADLAAAVAARYPQVRYFQVWNELKGFYDPTTNDWDVQAYIRLYRQVATAVRAVRPDALLGGPYVPIDIWADAATMSHPSDVAGPWGVVDRRSLDAITQFLDADVDVDFITVDGWTTTRDQGYITDPVTATGVYGTVTRWLRERTDLPIWWSEVHAFDFVAEESQATVGDAALHELEEAGADVALLWQPQGDPELCRGCLWRSDGTPTDLGRKVAARG